MFGSTEARPDAVGLKDPEVFRGFSQPDHDVDASLMEAGVRGGYGVRLEAHECAGFGVGDARPAFSNRAVHGAEITIIERRRYGLEATRLDERRNKTVSASYQAAFANREDELERDRRPPSSK